MSTPTSKAERNRVIDPECPHGGPYLCDGTMESAYRTAETIERMAWKRKGNVVRFKLFHDDKGDIPIVLLGELRSAVARMKAYIGALEARLGDKDDDEIAEEQRKKMTRDLPTPPPHDKDELSKHLALMFALHPKAAEHVGNPKLKGMDQEGKEAILAKINEFLGIKPLRGLGHNGGNPL